jgi:hypothetical protein
MCEDVPPTLYFEMFSQKVTNREDKCNIIPHVFPHVRLRDIGDTPLHHRHHSVRLEGLNH